jgi:hypothetical protein
MYYDTLKKILKKKTMWVVVEKGEWYYVAIEVCASKAEAEDFISKHSPSKHWLDYEIREQFVEDALNTFDERTKDKTIHNEGEEIAKRADRTLRLDIEREIEKKYSEKLKPIKDTLDNLIRQGV